MSDSVPVYLVGPPGGRLATVAATLAGSGEPIATEGGAAALVAERRPGIVVLEADTMRVGELVGILSALPEEQPWRVALVTDDDPPCLRTISLGARDTLGDVHRHASNPASTPGCLLDLDRALAEMSRLRHDLNNPLTAAMAETQLLLLDVSGDEQRESLESILQQLRRIRDMLASSRHLRPRRDAAGR
jgi:signal transduction histidine kinase